MKLQKTTVLFSIKAALMLGACLLTGSVKSQLYGEYGYGITNYRLCSGQTSVLYPFRPGLVMAGNAAIAGLSNQFAIVRTDQGGQMTSMPWVFANEYQIMYDPANSCAAPTSIASMCYGVSVLETNAAAPVAMGIRYVAAGAFNDGIFYAELSSTGAVMNTWFHFTTSTAAQQPSKPVICESTTNPGEYYIAGYDGTQLYAFKYVAGAPGPAASQFYSPGFRVPKAIIMSPYGPNDITVIGETATTSTLKDAFFLQLDNNSLVTTNYITYDYNNTDQGFTSIDIANSGIPNGPGFIVGGHSDFTGFPSATWFIKLDPAGNLNGFSNGIMCTNNPQTGAVVGVVERLNTMFQYEYYGALYSNNSVLVVKLDALGNPPAASEFKYQTGSSGNAYAIGLSNINTPGWPDEGLQIYIADSGVNPNDIYSAQSCFSGNSGCSIINGVQQVLNAPPAVNPSFLSTNGIIPGCYNSGLVINPNPVTLNTQPCGSAPYVGPAAAGGNNFRPAVATGISQVSADNTAMQVYPNPAADKVQVAVKTHAGNPVKIELFDYLGRLVTSVPVTGTNAIQTTEIDLASLDVQSGIYVISANINGNIQTQKIIYNKD